MPPTSWRQLRQRHGRKIAWAIFLVMFVFGRSYLFWGMQWIQRPLASLATEGSKLIGKTLGIEIESKDYKELLEQRNAFAVDQAKLNTLREENALLKTELHFLQKRSLKSVPANIIQRTASNQTSSLLIDVGTEEGIVIGDAVLVEDGMFIGKITSTEAHRSIVSTATDTHTATAVSLLNKTRTIGIAQGTSGNLIEIKFIPMDEIIAPNDIVVTSGLEDNIPSGLVVGIVNTVRPEPEAPFQQAVVEPLVNIQRYAHVIVLTPDL